MCGYALPYGYMGLIDGRWMLFSTEYEYYEYYDETNNMVNDSEEDI